MGNLENRILDMENRILNLELKADGANKNYNILLRKLNESQKLSKIGSWEWDIVDDTVIWSDMMFILLGIQPNDETPSYDLAFFHVHDNDKKEYEATLTDAYQNNKPYYLENRIQKKDKSVISVVSRGNCICDDSNTVIRMIGTVQDVTEKRKIEESNIQLQNFAYLASHDLKEPIRTIVGFSQLLKKSANDKLSDTEHEYLDFIIKGSKNMNMLVEGLLSYSRVDMEDRNIENINVRDMLDTIRYELNVLIESKNATIQTQNLSETIDADKVQMRQLFQNLITNAIRYSATERPPLIRISMQEEEYEWLFTVSDNGIGIEPEYYERIFLIFRKLHGDRDKGTGIGLALCKKVVENHGGRIWIESEYGKGSDFYFTINKNLG